MTPTKEIRNSESRVTHHVNNQEFKMKISRENLRQLIESIINEDREVNFKLPSPAKSSGVPMRIKGKTTVTFARSANARNRFVIISDHPFKANGEKASFEGPNMFSKKGQYFFETKLGGTKKKIVIDPDKRNQKFRVKSYSSR